MKNNDNKVFQIAEEIAFVKVLASNDLSLRNRAIKKLRRWIAAKSQNSKTAFTDDDFIRIWEGLFFSMWMSDKPLIQEECAETISNLIHAFSTEEVALSFIRSFYHMMCNKWSNIDTFRLDKFAMLVRRFTRHSLVLCKKHGWNDQLSQEFSMFINKPRLPQGLFFHFCDIIIEEICKVAGDDLNDDILIVFMRPFFKKLAETKYRPLAAYMKESVIKHFIDLTDIADEYREKFKIWQQSGFKGGRIDLIEKIEDPAGSDDDDDNLPIEQDMDTSLDPRPGCVDVMLPVIKIDPERYLKVLQEIKLEINRKSDNLSKLFTKFSQLKRGEYPYGLKKVKRGPNLKADIDEAVEKMVRQKLNGAADDESNEDCEDEDVRRKSNRKKLKRKSEATDVEDLGDIVAGKRGHWSITKSAKQNEAQTSRSKTKQDQWNISRVEIKKETQKKKKFTTDTMQKWNVESASKKSNSASSSKQNLNLLKDSGECWWRVSSVDEQSLNGDDSDIENKTSPVKQNTKKKSKIANSTETTTNVLYNGEPIASVTTVPSKLKHLSSPNQNTVAYPSMKLKGDIPVDDAPHELKATPLKPQNTRLSELKTPVTGKRRLSIRLDMNTSQDVEDHWATIASNPKVTIDEKPAQGILKPSPIPSPINPFYGKRKMRSNLVL